VTHRYDVVCMNLLTAEYKVRWSASMQRPMMLQLVWDVSGHKKNSNHCRVCEVCRCPVWCLWPSLPTAMQSSESMDIFRRHVKTELFARSYNWHRTCQMTLVLHDSLSLSRSFLLWPQPWSLSTIMLLWHSFLLLIIIIIIIIQLSLVSA